MQAFGHKIPTSYQAGAVWVELPMGRADLAASVDTLTMTANADTPEALAKAQQVMQSHLERFSFREDLEITWQHVSDAAA